MSASRISDRDTRALRLGILLAAPAFLYSIAIKPYLASIRRLDAQIATQSDMLQRERRLVAEAPSLPTRIAAERAMAQSVQRRVYSEQDPIAATSALSRDVSRAIEGAGASLQRLEARESVRRNNGLQELAVDVRVEGDFAAILRTIAALETAPHLIRVSRMAIDSGQLVATIRGFAP